MIPAAQLLRRVQNVTKETADVCRAIAIKAEGPVSCTAGCSFCCHQKLVGAAYEGVAIYLYLKARGAWTPELRARIVESDRAQTARTHRGHLMARLPCAFLKERSFGVGRCTVYPVRPSACATTFSVGEPARCAEVGERATFAIVNQRQQLRYLEVDRELAATYGEGYMELTTVAGAVLLTEARLEGLPRPDVHSIPIEDGRAASERFDQAATIPDGA